MSNEFEEQDQEMSMPEHYNQPNSCEDETTRIVIT